MIKHLRKSASSLNSLHRNDSRSKSIKKFALSKNTPTSQAFQSSTNLPSLLYISGAHKNSMIEIYKHASSLNTNIIDKQINQHTLADQHMLKDSDYYIQTGLENAPIIQRNSKSSKNKINIKRHLEYMPIQLGHFCYHKSDKRLSSLPNEHKRCLSQNHMKIRPTPTSLSKNKIRLQQRKHRDPYPDSRPKILSDKIEYFVCRIPSPAFVKSGQSGQSKVTRLDSEISIKEIGSGMRNSARYSLTKFEHSKKKQAQKSPSLSKNQSPNLSPQSLSPVTSRIIIFPDMTDSFVQPLTSLSAKINILPIHSPPQSQIKSPLVSPKSSFIAPNKNLPPIAPKPPISSSDSLKQMQSLKRLCEIPLQTSQKSNISSRKSFQRNPIIFTSRVSDSFHDPLSSQVSGSGIIANLKSSTLRTAASSGMFTLDSIRQPDQYQLETNCKTNSKLRSSETSIKI